jgi:type II restriction/modification system DNA methylase subunit YeeA
LESGYNGHKLEVFLVRLVYCLFADDTSIFLPRSSFLTFLQNKTSENGSNLGTHYTSEKNILKVIRGLFLDELYAEFDGIKNNQNKLREFQNKLSRLKFFGPACGCGNFLVITYREIRNLEIEVLKRLRELTGNIQLQFDITGISKIDVDLFYGIEYEEFPAEIARGALWLRDHQENMALSTEFGLPFVRLPLRKSANIVHGNALRIDWNEVVSTDGNETETTLYILGNPPFVGKDKRTADQTADMEFCYSDVQNFKPLDYVCAWYIKTVKFIGNTKIKVAFVSTNSITQGEQIGILWQYLLDKGAKYISRIEPSNGITKQAEMQGFIRQNLRRWHNGQRMANRCSCD